MCRPIIACGPSAVWLSWAVVRPWITFRLDHVDPSGAVLVAGDETVTEHPGLHVFGQGRHRDGVVVDPQRYRLPLGSQMGGRCRGSSSCQGPPRPWALPVLVSPRTTRRNGIACTARGRRRQPTSPGSCWPAWYAGFRSVTSSLWVTRAMARARRPDCAVSAIVISPWSASLMGMPRCLSLRHGARAAQSAARG